MKRDLTLVLMVAVVTALAVRTWLPRRIPSPPQVPHIITRTDTVRALPSWFQDSVKVWSKRRHTTDTVTLTTNVLVVDTLVVRVPVNLPPEQRPNRWPIQSYHGGARFGDTAVVESYNLRSGQLAISRTFIPGILTALEWDSLPNPKFTFTPFLPPKKPSLWVTLKTAAIGYGVCSVVNVIRPL
jgi:hypothetical protein